MAGSVRILSCQCGLYRPISCQTRAISVILSHALFQEMNQVLFACYLPAR